MGFVLAEKKHDRQIRKMLHESAQPGNIQVAYCREPDYFHGIEVCGKLNQTLIYEHGPELKAISIRSIKPVFINGKTVDFGYLSGLRIAADSRRGIILGRGYQALRKLHGDNKVKAYLTTIVDKNVIAKTVLTSGKAHIPAYRDIGKYHVYTVLFNRYKRCDHHGVDIINGNEVSLKQILSFLRENGSRKQFYPVYTPDDFNTGYTRDFLQKDFYIAVQGSRITGVVGAWNQTDYKQHVITGYNGILNGGKIIVDTALRVSGFKPLPKQNEAVKAFTISFACIRDDNPGVLSALLCKIYYEKRKLDFHGFSIGFHERDTLRIVMNNFFCIPYTSRIYLVYWEDGKEFCEKTINSKVPYLELGTL